MAGAIKWILGLGFIPRGWLTIAAGFGAVLSGIACFAGVPIPGLDCPSDPWLLVTGGAAVIGFGRR